jgi:3-phenylpropionate/trans-cinnamate dioxygenase ferredoxin component
MSTVGYVRVCSVSELPADGAVRRVDVDGAPVAIVSTGGEHFAIDDVCSHDEVSLADGDVDGHTVQCWLHGSRFDVRTGRALSLPAKKSVPVFDMKIEGDGVYVSTSPQFVPTKQESNA